MHVTYIYVCVCMHTMNRHHDSAWPYYLHLIYANCSGVIQDCNISIKKYWFLMKEFVEILVHYRPTTCWPGVDAVLHSEYYTQSSFQLAYS